MPYQLILSEPTIQGECKSRDVGKNVFLDNLPSGYPVYLFYYPGAMPNQELERKLRNLGDITGKNLFVNIGRLNDPRYREIASIFVIKTLPVVILTAIDKLASPSAKFLTMYTRIDSKRLMESPDLVVQCSQTLFNLFIQGKIAEALNHARYTKRKALISHLEKTVFNALKTIWEWMKDIDVSVCLIEGKFELKHSGR